MPKEVDWVRTHPIKTLLLSQTVDNTALSIEMIAKGSVNKILLSYLTAIALKHPNRTVRERAISVLQQHAPPKLQVYLQPHFLFLGDEAAYRATL